MLRKNQNGFGAVELILIVVAIGIVGGAGWYVWNSQNATKDTLNSIPDAQNDPQKSEKKAASQENPTSNAFNDPAVGIVLKYPSGWTAKIVDKDPNSGSIRVEVSSPDLKKKETAIGGSYDILSGAEFSLYQIKNGSNKSIEDVKTKGLVGQASTNRVESKVSGEPALSYDLSYEGPAKHTIVFFKNGTEYSLSTNKSVYDQAQYKKIFDDIVSSLQTK